MTNLLYRPRDTYEFTGFRSRESTVAFSCWTHCSFSGALPATPQDRSLREVKIEDWLRIGCENLGGFCLKLNPLWFIGIPDRLCLLPGGRAIFVETKAPDGVLRGKQSRVHAWLKRLGFRVEVLWTIEQVEEFLCSVRS